MLEEDSPASVAIATDLAIPVIAGGGISALTPTSIADRAGCSRQAVHQWFGGRPLGRVVAGRFAARWQRWTEVRVHCHGLGGLLPENDEVADWTRVWLALVELSGRDAEVGSIVAATRDGEVELIRTALTRCAAVPSASPATPREDEVLALHCLTEGLRLRLLAPVDESALGPALTFDMARRVLEQAGGLSSMAARHLA